VIRFILAGLLAARVAAGPGVARAWETRKAEPPVTLEEDKAGFTLANGFVSARIDKRSGDLVSLKFKDLELLGKASGRPFAYWSHNGGGSLGSSRESAIVQDPSTNGGKRAIVSCKFLSGKGGNLPADVDLRFSLGQGDSGVYVYSIWTHKPDDPALRLGEARYTVKLNERVFDYLTIDAKRRKVMPTPADWDKGEPLNMKEVRRMTTGIYAGKPEHKYDYSAVQFDTPAFGWSSTKEHVGLWVVNPTIEYLGGGPTKVELTGHLDVNTGAAPTLCNYWVGSHYGGSSFLVRQGEDWTKVVGPMLIYCNAAPGHEAIWKDALAKAAKEAEAWPYDWAADANYPGKSGRGTVAGQVRVIDPLTLMDKVRNVLVGLTRQSASENGAPVDWQKDAQAYQFWVRADKNGGFTIPNVRPGTYTLRAIADGVLGEFSLRDVAVTAGQTKTLGKLEWKPVRYGRQLWEIGIPNRSAEEFRHGDQYWQWGLYHDYAKEFPDDVNFVVGKSDWKKDWNYCQPPRIEGNRVQSTTWSITFDLPEAPKGQATLRLAICGSLNPRGIEVTVNEKSTGRPVSLPASGVMHRDGIRGYWCERNVPFDAGLLKAGANVLQLKAPVNNWTQGVLYDYLRLELDESAPAPKEP
jgi:rhamnogalacturonan endolyase